MLRLEVQRKHRCAAAGSRRSVADRPDGYERDVMHNEAACTSVR